MFFYFFFYFAIGVLTFENLTAKHALEEYLLPLDHPLHPVLERLIQQNDENLSGFQIYKMKERLMILGHPQLKGYLIKKYKNFVPSN